jgi:hypothetical protein
LPTQNMYQFCYHTLGGNASFGCLFSILAIENFPTSNAVHIAFHEF